MSETPDHPGCLFGLLRLLAGGAGDSGQAQPERLPYARRPSLLSKAERSFFGVLLTAVGDDYIVFAKVRLADVLRVEKGRQDWRSWFNRINAKHIDFVLCDPRNLAAKLAIELNDSSHGRADRRQRDDFVAKALGAAGVPHVFLPARRSYNPSELRAQIDQACA